MLGIPLDWPPILIASFGYYSLFGGWLDTVLLLAFSLWRQRAPILDCLPLDRDSLQSVALALPGFVLGFVIFQLLRLLVATQDGPRWNGTAKPLLIPCRTTHERLFPTKHAFSYSYLMVGIPIGWVGSAGGMLSTEIKNESGILSWFSFRPAVRKAWYDVDPAGYLERGSSHLGLRGKLDAYLKSQVGESISLYSGLPSFNVPCRMLTP
jgi:Protein of unknown function (DUF1365)